MTFELNGMLQQLFSRLQTMFPGIGEGIPWQGGQGQQGQGGGFIDQLLGSNWPPHGMEHPFGGFGGGNMPGSPSRDGTPAGTPAGMPAQPGTPAPQPPPGNSGFGRYHMPRMPGMAQMSPFGPGGRTSRIYGSPLTPSSPALGTPATPANSATSAVPPNPLSQQ